MKVQIFKIRLGEEFLHHDQKILDDFLQSSEILNVETAFVNDENCWSVIIYFEKAKSHQHTVKDSKINKYSAEDDELSFDEIKILEALKNWRSGRAREQNLPIYFIATNKELISVAKYKPAKKEELLDIKGFGKHKIENYGMEIIDILENI